MRGSATRGFGVATLAVVILAFCAGVASAVDRPLKIGIYENKPLTYRSDDGEWTGVIPEVYEEIARREGWSYEYVEVEFTAGVEALQRRQLDMLFAVADTKERREIIAFPVTSVIANWGVLSVLDSGSLQSFTDLRELTIAVNSGDVYYEGSGGLRDLSESLGVKMEFVEYPSYLAVLEAVRDGKADAGLTSRLFAAINGGELGLEESALVMRPTRLSVALPRDGEFTGQIISGVDRILPELIDDEGSAYHDALERHLFAGRPPGGLPGWVIWTAAGTFAALLVSVGVTSLLRVQVTRRTEALANATERLSTVIDAIPDAYLRLDSEDRIIDARSGRDFDFATEVDMALRPSLLSAVPPEIAVLTRAALLKAREIGSSVVEYALPGPGTPGRVQWFEARITASTNGELLVLIRDITAQRVRADTERGQRQELEALVAERTAELQATNEHLAQTVEELQQANRARDVFTANVSHELRTPLNSIIGFTGVLLQGLAGELNEEQRHQLGMVYRSGNHLLQLVNDILDLERLNLGAGRLVAEEFDPAALAHAMEAEFRVMAERKQLKLEVVIEGDPPVMYTDRRQVAQVLTNLGANAVKFTDAGSVTVTVSEGAPGEVVFTVSDTGCGIEPEEIESVFDEFSQVSKTGMKPDGTGLGLAISQRIAERLGGSLEVTSMPGLGSTFVLKLPAAWSVPLRQLG